MGNTIGIEPFKKSGFDVNLFFIEVKILVFDRQCFAIQNDGANRPEIFCWFFKLNWLDKEKDRWVTNIVRQGFVTPLCDDLTPVLV